MKRILFISQHLNRAGTEAFMMSVFRGIDHSRFQVDFLLYTQKETDYSREVESAGNNVWRVPSRRESPLGWYRKLNDFFKKHANEYAAIHYCGNGLTAIAPIILAYAYKVPIRICHAHNSSSRGLHNKILHLTNRSIAKRLTTHHFACSTLAAKWFFGTSPATIIKNGIDTQRFAYNKQVREDMRKTMNITDSTTVIGHIGRFQKEKNHTFLLDIFAAYTKQHPDALLLLVGVGTLQNEIREKADILGLSNKVQFLGERPDVPQLLQAMDIFLMPSTFEGQPFVLIEAQCTGLPCLVSDVINRDICLTPNVSMLSLSQTAETWTTKINVILSSYLRHDESKTIKQKGYSINNTISYLECIYDGKE